jgi:hypothetical protein
MQNPQLWVDMRSRMSQETCERCGESVEVRSIRATRSVAESFFSSLKTKRVFVFKLYDP